MASGLGMRPDVELASRRRSCCLREARRGDERRVEELFGPGPGGQCVRVRCHPPMLARRVELLAREPPDPRRPVFAPTALPRGAKLIEPRRPRPQTLRCVERAHRMAACRVVYPISSQLAARRSGGRHSGTSKLSHVLSEERSAGIGRVVLLLGALQTTQMYLFCGRAKLVITHRSQNEPCPVKFREVP